MRVLELSGSHGAMGEQFGEAVRDELREFYVRRVANALASAREYGKREASEQELLEAARDCGSTTFHVMGTCRMSPANDATAVVDDQLRVHGVESLRVIDASVMPAMVSANLNAATMMIAEKGADLVLGRSSPEPVVIAD